MRSRIFFQRFGVSILTLLAGWIAGTFFCAERAVAETTFTIGFSCTVDPQILCDDSESRAFATTKDNTGLTLTATAGHATPDCSSGNIQVQVDGNDVGTTGLLAPGQKTGEISLGSFAPGSHTITLTQAAVSTGSCGISQDYSISLLFTVGKAKPATPTPTSTPTPTPTPSKVLKLAIDPSGGASATGSVANKVSVNVNVSETNGTPVPNQAVNVDIPFFDGQFALPEPRLVICDNSGRRVYPSSENNDLFAFQRATDGLGNLSYDVYLGTDVGGPNLSDHQLFLSAKLPNFMNADQHDGHFLPLLNAPGNTFGDVAGSITALVASGGQLNGAKTNLAGQLATLGSLQAIQDGLLAMFNEIRVADPTILQNSDFGPIHSADGQQGAILFYPKNNPYPLLNHFDGDALTNGYITAVLPIDRVITGDYQPQVGEFMSLTEWENGSNIDNKSTIAHGRALGGRAAAEAGDDVRFFGYPYPPAVSEQSAYDAASRCLGPAPMQVSVVVHSPVNLLFTDQNGKTFGFDSTGDLVSTIPGVVYVAGTVQIYILPVGKYSITVTGTGKGSATIVVTSPGSDESLVEVFQFEAAKGQHGTLQVADTGSPVGKLKFGKKTIKGVKGLTLAVHGLPHHVTGEKTKNYTVTVTDQFKKPVPGAVISASGSKLSSTAISNAAGVAHLALIAPSRGEITIRVKVPGFLSFQSRIAATFVPPKKNKE